MHEYMSENTNIHKISSTAPTASECWANLIGISIASSFRSLPLLRFEGSDCKSVSIAESLSRSCWAECVSVEDKVDHAGIEPGLERSSLFVSNCSICGAGGSVSGDFKEEIAPSGSFEGTTPGDGQSS